MYREVIKKYQSAGTWSDDSSMVIATLEWLDIIPKKKWIMELVISL